MREGARRLAQGALDHGMHLGLGGRRRARRARLVAQQTLKTLLSEPLLPSPNHRAADANPLGDLQDRQMIGREQDDLRPLNVLHGPAPIVDDPPQPGAILSRHKKRDSLSHVDGFAQPNGLVNPPCASVH